MKSRTTEDHENKKFTEESQVKITGHAMAKVVNTFDGNGNMILSKDYSARRQTTLFNWEKVSLQNNTAFRIYSTGDVHSFYVWFNVDGIGSDPLLSGTGVEIPISTTATDAQITESLVTAINNSSNINPYIRAKKEGTYKVSLKTLEYGITTNSSDIDTGAMVTTWLSGSDYELVSETQITYDADDNPVTIIRLEH